MIWMCVYFIKLTFEFLEPDEEGKRAYFYAFLMFMFFLMSATIVIGAIIDLFQRYIM